MRSGLILVPVALAALSAAPGRAPRTTARILELLQGSPHRGNCEQCHTEHGRGEIPRRFALVGPDDNSLCDDCHRTAWEGGSYAGTWAYAGSAHGASGSMVWPGPDPPPRTEPQAPGKCVNCHDPHGWEDDGGIIPGLRLKRGQALCLSCHDGQPASSDIANDVQKPFRHGNPGETDRHGGPLESSPADFAASPIDHRHAECEDCHNPHLARQDPESGIRAPAASWRLLGASRVRVVNGAAGSLPAYTFIAGSDTLTAPVAEYQLCFKCHSSWTVQPTGQTDMARVLNPANPSYHPVEARGRNPNIRPGAFEAGWSATSLTYCSDCHGSDTGLSRGPHGSAYRYILRRPYTASSARRSMTSDEACFECHAYSVYADPEAGALGEESRFNRPGADKGHAEHVAEEGVPCYACHVTHGSTTHPHLIVTGRVPGINAYTSTPTGGTCSATCHEGKSYTVNYAR